MLTRMTPVVVCASGVGVGVGVVGVCEAALLVVSLVSSCLGLEVWSKCVHSDLP